MKRFFRHLLATRWSLRQKFSTSVLDDIESAIKRSEATHGGEIRFAIEAGLSPAEILSGLSPRHRALQVFSHLHVWDTQANNGVLIYVLLADRQVEIVADRGFNDKVPPEQWEHVCQGMEQSFASGDYRAAALAAVARVGALMAKHFTIVDRNEQADRPTIL